MALEGPFLSYFKQTSANTSTWYPYLKKICCLVNYSCMNLWQISPKYSLRPQFEYLYLGRIWQLHVIAKQICSNYLSIIVRSAMVNTWPIIINLLFILLANRHCSPPITTVGDARILGLAYNLLVFEWHFYNTLLCLCELYSYF